MRPCNGALPIDLLLSLLIRHHRPYVDRHLRGPAGQLEGADNTAWQDSKVKETKLGVGEAETTSTLQKSAL
jgi:hypothetical protein